MTTRVVSAVSPWHAHVLLTCVAQDLNIPVKGKNIEGEVVVHRVEVGRAVQLSAIQPADEDGGGELVERLECQLLLCWGGLGSQQLSENWDLLGEKVIVGLECLVCWSNKEGRLQKLCRCRRLGFGVIGME